METTKVAEVLKGAAELYERFGWTKNQLACDENGKRCRVKDPQAVAFCALGAIQRYLIDNKLTETTPSYDYVVKIAETVCRSDRVLSRFNDFHCKSKEDAKEHLIKLSGRSKAQACLSSI